MNNAVFAGFVGNVDDMRYTPQGKAVLSFSIAVDQGKNKDGEKLNPLWVKATLWDKKAEGLAQHIRKGICVVVSGPVTTESWTNKQSGEAQSKLVVTVREFTFAGVARGGSEQQATEPAARPNEPSPITDEDIPF